ncbi:unnamed protein product [Cylindrotheca closterium]|uniref:Uncharacterized protein n=1 Tax=Cylindrotheca closterium TaxID=2856 RepID=A0AAD2FBG9_9STRA|nr:unnamed protein product [Cylindrotheca closterium]
MCRPSTASLISDNIIENLILSVALVAATAIVFAPQFESIWKFFLVVFDNSHNHLTTKGTDIQYQLTNQHLEPIAKRQWSQLLGWITFHSDQVGKLRDSKGQTLLHHACLFQSPLLVIECILWAAPELASVPNKDGEVPLHWAVRLSSQNPVLSILLKTDPDTAFVVDYTKSTPLAMMWERHYKPSMEIFRYRPEVLASNNAWKRLMCVLQAVSQAQGSQEFYPLHIAAQKVTPTGLFPFLVQVYEDQLLIEDENGHTPLTIACQNPEANRSIDVHTKIGFLLNANPEQAKHPVPNSNGKFHLHYALEAGIGWKEGLEALIRINPFALSERDPSAGLYPFALAAVAATNHCNYGDAPEGKQANSREMMDHHLTTIYDLLRSDPSLLRMQVVQQ